MKWIAGALLLGALAIAAAIILTNNEETPPTDPTTRTSNALFVQGEIVEQLGGSCDIGFAGATSMQFYDNDGRELVGTIAVDPPDLVTGAPCHTVANFSGQINRTDMYIVEWQFSTLETVSCTIVTASELQDYWKPIFPFLQPPRASCQDWYPGED